MPGILPMKVIKVGTSSQSRIAQACDRCRSKKIRCDGVTPCCTQCKNVGFECKTSDKLSRRAFPRGYTESLEERVRALEAEIRELKDLLDERDEKIDLLSKIHSFSTSSQRPSCSSSPRTLEEATQSPASEPKDDSFQVRQVPFLQKAEQKSDPFFMGTSSTRAFFDTVKCKIQESGKPVAKIYSNTLFGRADLVKPAKRADLSKNVPCMISDQLINIFFQEWSPLFPVLHRPTFLSIYKTYASEPESIKDPIAVAQLNLVFGTAALANESSKELLPYFESQWQGALGVMMNEQKLSTLQCLVLAQIYCMAKGDYNKLLYYTGVAVNLSHRLGMHQSQNRFDFGALTRETRKKVFWTLYTLDAFAAAALGLPKLLKDADIETEEPSDVDDENVNERGFQATLPGESTKLSSALALFRAARILSKVLDELYPATSSCELSLQRVAALSDELDAWRSNLAPHLRLDFVLGKPSTNIVSSRCPLLALAYFHIRSLIHRPVVNSESQQSQQYLLAVADSSKRLLQIIQLLNERNLSFTMCINKMELMIASGLGMILQMLDRPAESKLYKDTQQSLASVMEFMEHSATPAAMAFKKFCTSFVNPPKYATPGSRRSSSSSTCCPPISQGIPMDAKSHLETIAARFSFNGVRQPKLKAPFLKQEHKHSALEIAPTTVATSLALHARMKGSTSSRSSTASDSVVKAGASQSSIPSSVPPSWITTPNLDYLPLGSQFLSNRPSAERAPDSPDITDWDHLISTFDPFDISPQQQTGPALVSINSSPPQCVSSYGSPSMPVDWDADLGIDSWGLLDMLQQDPMAAKSVPSLSDESLTSGEELSSCDLGSEFRGYSIPHDDFSADELATAQTTALG